MCRNRHEYEFRPNVIDPCRIDGVLEEVDAFLEYRKINDALECSDYRTGEFKTLPQFADATQYYIELDETGRHYSEKPGNDRKYWWLHEISQRADKIRFIIGKEGPRTHIIEGKGCYEFALEETTVDDMTIHFAQLLRTTTQKVLEEFDSHGDTTIIVDTIHVVASSPSGQPIHPRAECAAWTNGYTKQQIEDLFSQHEIKWVADHSKGMTTGALWSHTRAHQEASKLADENMPDSVRRILHPLRFSIHAQVGGVEEILSGLRPLFFDDFNDFQLSWGSGPSEDRPKINFERPPRMQIAKAREQIARMILEGAPMHGFDSN